MINPATGEFRMIEADQIPATLAAGFLVVEGTEAEVRKVSTAIKLGNREIDKRSARRKQQRAARRKNR